MKKILIAVALLLTVVSGAWAQNEGQCSLSQSVVNGVLGQLSSVV